MAQTPEQMIMESLGLADQDPNAAVTALLAEGLQTESQRMQAQAQDEVIRIRQNQEGAYVQEAVDSTLYDLISPTENVVGRLPAGGQVIAQRGLRTVKDPRTGDELLVAPKIEHTAALNKAPVDAHATVQSDYRLAGQPRTTFNITEEYNRLSTLKGVELLQAQGQLMSNIALEVAKEREAIRNQAALRSGLREAEAALQANITLDRKKGGVFATQASAETERAQDVHKQALQMSTTYEASLVESSSRLRELKAYEVSLGHAMQWLGQRDIIAEQQRQRDIDLATTRGEAAAISIGYKHGAAAIATIETNIAATRGRIKKMSDNDPNLLQTNAKLQELENQRKAMLNSAVPDSQLLNYRIIYGTQGSDDQDRMAILKKQGKDKVLNEVLVVDKTNLVDMLMDPGSGRAEKALKILSTRDKLLNLPSDTTMSLEEVQKIPDSPLVQQLRKISLAATSPERLMDAAVSAGLFAKDADFKAQRQRLMTADSKTRELERRSLVAQVVNAAVTSHLINGIVTDVRQWKTSETSGDAPLAKILATISGNEKGQISLQDFVTQTILTDIVDPSGAMWDDARKQEELNKAVRVAAQNVPKSFLMPNTAAIEVALLAQTNNAVGRAKFRRFFAPSPSQANPFIGGY